MKIAVLGTGFMGFPMARRLCEAGHSVQVWNRSRDKAERMTGTDSLTDIANRRYFDRR